MILSTVRIRFEAKRFDGEEPDLICYERVHFVPREGERIEISNRLYEVARVTWHLYKPGTHNVTLYLERL